VRSAHEYAGASASADRACQAAKRSASHSPRSAPPAPRSSPRTTHLPATRAPPRIPASSETTAPKSQRHPPETRRRRKGAAAPDEGRSTADDPSHNNSDGASTACGVCLMLAVALARKPAKKTSEGPLTEPTLRHDASPPNPDPACILMPTSPPSPLARPRRAAFNQQEKTKPDTALSNAV
jgi:hypothetical protein